MPDLTLKEQREIEATVRMHIYARNEGKDIAVSVWGKGTLFRITPEEWWQFDNQDDRLQLVKDKLDKALGLT